MGRSQERKGKELSGASAIRKSFWEKRGLVRWVRGLGEKCVHSPSLHEAAKPQLSNSEGEGAFVVLRKPGNACRPPFIKGLQGSSYSN